MKKLHLRWFTKQLMVLVLCFGLFAYVVRTIFFVGTVYSAEYAESRFQQIRVGMTSEEVEALMGPPLEKVPWTQEGFVNWKYTDSRLSFNNYWMRDVFMKDGKVVNVVNIYWVD